MRAFGRRVAVALVSLATLSSALVLPEALAHLPSTPRKSLNFGPHAPASVYSFSNPSVPLSTYNAALSLGRGATQGACGLSRCETGSCYAQTTALPFMELLHPQGDFLITNEYATQHLNVCHLYFLEVVDGLPVANGNLNINIDLETGHVISYSDSTLRRPMSTERVMNVEGEIASSAEDGSQIVFGGSSDRARPDLEEFSSPPFVPVSQRIHALKGKYNPDPRFGLLTFLALQSPSDSLTEYLASAPHTTLVNSIAMRSVSDDGDAFSLTDVPTALEPVSADLQYLQVGDSLRLVWRYVLRTSDNHYEAYVSAEPTAAGQEETLQVVDWVRDFRPTGGELGFEALQSQAGFGEAPRGGEGKWRIGKAGAGARKGGKFVVAPLAYAAEVEPVVEREAEDYTAAQQIIEDAKKDGGFTYRVFPWGVNDPSEGKRANLKGTLLDMDNEASPVGWHTIPAQYQSGKDKYYLDTRGNNVFAQDNPDGGNSFEYNYRPTAENTTFSFPLNWPKAGTPLEPASYINASVTELFYTNNEIHDLYYRYGFDEVSGNFQEYNFGRGGYGGDAVQANAQDGSGMNNANFATPPDGSRPRMRMYSWSGTQPYRDGDFEAGIVIHEASHGLSTRLTGGPANSGCLGWAEPGGMGEGYGDFLATMIRQHSANETEFSMGEWASARKGGIRNFVYSRNMSVNPSTYKTLDSPGYWGVHAIGEVWAEILFTVAELLIDEHGFSSTLFPPHINATDDGGFYSTKNKKKVPKAGNTLIIQLLIDSMKLQPCRPSFADARDAIIQADQILTGGENECILWKGFSLRGLGPDAKLVGGTPWGGGVHSEDFSLPTRCSKKDKKKVIF